MHALRVLSCIVYPCILLPPLPHLSSQMVWPAAEACLPGPGPGPAMGAGVLPRLPRPCALGGAPGEAAAPMAACALPACSCRPLSAPASSCRHAAHCAGSSVCPCKCSSMQSTGPHLHQGSTTHAHTHTHTYTCMYIHIHPPTQMWVGGCCPRHHALWPRWYPWHKSRPAATVQCSAAQRSRQA